MPNYRRLRIGGGTYFFTLTLRERRSRLLTEHVGLLRLSCAEVLRRRPCRIVAGVVFPDHLHLVAQLPDGDDDYSNRISLLKAGFTQSVATARQGQRQEARARRLAEPVLGTRDPGRRRSQSARGLRALQPGEAWVRRKPGPLAVLDMAQENDARSATEGTVGTVGRAERSDASRPCPAGGCGGDGAMSVPGGHRFAQPALRSWRVMRGNARPARRRWALPCPS